MVASCDRRRFRKISMPFPSACTASESEEPYITLSCFESAHVWGEAYTQSIVGEFTHSFRRRSSVALHLVQQRLIAFRYDDVVRRAPRQQKQRAAG